MGGPDNWLSGSRSDKRRKPERAPTQNLLRLRRTDNKLSVPPGDIVLTHGDPDHAGGLADFPAARVHLSVEEHAQLTAGRPRYSAAQFAHGPRWETYGPSPRQWFGLEARPIPALAWCDALLIPLFGHTRGHCGVALRDGERWLLHVGDAYYLRAELTDDNHPVSQLAKLRAEDDQARRQTLSQLRRLAGEQGEQITLTGYHDFTEFPTPPVL